MEVNGDMVLRKGSRVRNLRLDSGPALPSTSNQATLFWLTEYYNNFAPGFYAHNGLTWELVAQNIETIPVWNTLPDSGRFTGKRDPQAPTATNNFAVQAHFTPFNGASNWSSAGRFFMDNRTNGGAGNALSQDMQDLLAKMQRVGPDARNGVEFHIAQITAGSGTSVPVGGGHLVTINQNRAIFGSDNYVTLVCWLRAKVGGPIWIGQPHYKNGVSVLSGSSINMLDGWTHVRITQQKSNGLDTAFPYIGANQGTLLQMALPVIIPGIADIGLHTIPIATLNGMNA